MLASQIGITCVEDRYYLCRRSVLLASQIGITCVEDRYYLCRRSVFTRISSLQCALALAPAAKLCICRIFSASWIYRRHGPGTRGRRCTQVLLCERSVFFCVRHRYSCFSLHSPHDDFAFRGPYLCGRSVSLPTRHQVSEEAARPMHEDGERRPSSPQLLTAKLARPSSARLSNKDDSQSTA